MTPKLHTWTAEENLMLRREYRHTVQSQVQLSSKLGVTVGTLRAQLARLGLCYIRRFWSPLEEAQLAKLAGSLPPEAIAKRLHRSVNSVLRKSHRSKVSVSIDHRDGWYTAKDIAYIIGVDLGWVTRRIHSGALVAKPYYGLGKSSKGSHPWCITKKDFISFLQRYPEELEGHNVSFTALIDLLSGPSGKINHD